LSGVTDTFQKMAKAFDPVIAEVKKLVSGDGRKLKTAKQHMQGDEFFVPIFGIGIDPLPALSSSFINRFQTVQSDFDLRLFASPDNLVSNRIWDAIKGKMKGSSKVGDFLESKVRIPICFLFYLSSSPTDICFASNFPVPLSWID